MQDHVLIGPGVFSLHLPCRKQFQYLFNSQQWIDTWRSKFKQKTLCVLLACWSERRKSPRSRKILITLCRVMPDTCKNTWYSGLILIWESSEKDWSSIRQDRTQSSFREYFHQVALWELKDWKAENHCIKAIFVASSTTEDLFERHDLNWTRGNDELGSTVGTSTSRETRSTVTWRNSSIWFFHATQSPKTNEDRSGKPVVQEIVGVLQEETKLFRQNGENPWQRKNNMSEITTAQGNLKERRYSTQCKKIIISKKSW